MPFLRKEERIGIGNPSRFRYLCPSDGDSSLLYTEAQIDLVPSKRHSVITLRAYRGAVAKSFELLFSPNQYSEATNKKQLCDLSIRR